MTPFFFFFFSYPGIQDARIVIAGSRDENLVAINAPITVRLPQAREPEDGEPTLFVAAWVGLCTWTNTMDCEAALVALSICKTYWLEISSLYTTGTVTQGSTSEWWASSFFLDDRCGYDWMLV